MLCAVFILSEQEITVIIPDTKEHVRIKVEGYGDIYITPKNLWEQSNKGNYVLTVESKQS